MASGQEAILVSSISAFFALIIFALRCISRVFMIRNVGLDDIFAAFAMLSAIVFAVLIAIQAQYGLGQDQFTSPRPDVVYDLKLIWASTLAYIVGITVVKCSAIFQYLRFIPHGRMRTFCWILLGLLTGFGIAGCFVNAFACSPVAAFWNSTPTHESCIHLFPWYFFAAAFLIITDIIMVAIPIITFKDMNLRHREKMALKLVFALGGCVCIVSFIRLGPIYRLVISNNATKHYADAGMFSSLELNVAIVCVSLPPLKPILTAVAPSLLRSDPSERSSDLSGDTLPKSPEIQMQSEPDKTPMSIAQQRMFP